MCRERGPGAGELLTASPEDDIRNRISNRTVGLRQKKAPAARSSRSPGEEGDSDTSREMRHWQGIQKFHDLPAMTSNVRYRKPVTSRRRRQRCCGKFERDPLAADGKRRVNSYYRLGTTRAKARNGDYTSQLSVQTLAVWDRRRNWRPRGITACRNIE
jgi:hypothetical protein